MRSSLLLALKLLTTLIRLGPRKRRAVKAFSETLRKRGLPKPVVNELTEIYRKSIIGLKDIFNFIGF